MSFFDKVSADKSQLGFDYQDLVCLYYLIDMKQGESVGLEVFDDVHHERINGSNSLIQVKHSITEGNSLTNKDIDLWKTLYNWSKALEELMDSKPIEFIFFTNKKKTNRTGLIQIIGSQPLNIDTLDLEVSKIKVSIDAKEKNKGKGDAENPIKKYVDHIYGLSHTNKQKLFSKIKIIFSDEDIFSRLAEKIEYFSVRKEQSLDVVHQLIGVFRKKKYELIKSGKKVLIDYETFRKEFQFDRTIQLSQDRKIDFSRYHHFKNVNIIDPKNGLFARQLTDIEITPEEITECAIEYAATNMFIQKLIVNGEFSQSENDSISNEVYYGWKNSHGRLYDTDSINTSSEHHRVARNCFRSIGDIPVNIANSTLSRQMVIGKGVELSDLCRIGWKKNWEDIYGNKK